MAALYLRCKGYKILEKRYKTPFGEIDILARHGKNLVAVEVKSRETLEKAYLALTLSQKRRIEGALLFYLSGKISRLDLRFDVVLISPWQWPCHIEGAWFIE